MPKKWKGIVWTPMGKTSWLLSEAPVRPGSAGWAELKLVSKADFLVPPCPLLCVCLSVCLNRTNRRKGRTQGPYKIPKDRLASKANFQAPTLPST